jgi:hypothetical protein
MLCISLLFFLTDPHGISPILGVYSFIVHIFLNPQQPFYSSSSSFKSLSRMERRLTLWVLVVSWDVDDDDIFSFISVSKIIQLIPLSVSLSLSARFCTTCPCRKEGTEPSNRRRIRNQSIEVCWIYSRKILQGKVE